jgi:phosphatidylserine/phosphatidylglycerophosphate/cardiolipin synthase-like enzyme
VTAAGGGQCWLSSGHRLLVSSANLTEHALTVNLELGVLITGGPAPYATEGFFNFMIHSGNLALVTN